MMKMKSLGDFDCAPAWQPFPVVLAPSRGLELQVVVADPIAVVAGSQLGDSKFVVALLVRPEPGVAS